MKTTLRITLTDNELIMKVRSIPKSDRGRIIQRALRVYFETAGGREVYELFAKGKARAASGDREEKPLLHESSGKLRDVLGDY
jgi:hypothetical protein